VLFYRKYERIQGLLRNAFIADRLNNGPQGCQLCIIYFFFKKTAIANSQLQFFKAFELFAAIALEEILGLMIRLIGEVIQI